MVGKWVARGNIKYILQMELDSPLGLMLLCLGNVTMASLASHTPCREEGSGHTAITEEHNYWTKPQDNKMLTSAKHVVT